MLHGKPETIKDAHTERFVSHEAAKRVVHRELTRTQTGTGRDCITGTNRATTTRDEREGDRGIDSRHPATDASQENSAAGVGIKDPRSHPDYNRNVEMTIGELDRISAGLAAGTIILYRARCVPLVMRRGKGTEEKPTGIDQLEVSFKEMK